MDVSRSHLLGVLYIDACKLNALPTELGEKAQGYLPRFAELLTNSLKGCCDMTKHKRVMPRNIKTKRANSILDLKIETKSAIETGASWTELPSTSGSRLLVRPVDEEIVKKMPKATTTFVQRGILDLIRLTLQKATKART